jgi:hypothetical protein
VAQWNSVYSAASAAKWDDLGNVAYCHSLYAAASEDMALYLTQGKSFSIPPSLFFRLRWEILLFVPR